MSFRIAHISDPHLSGEKPYFVANFLRVAGFICERGADLVLNSGDMSLDGSAKEADLIEARRLHGAMDLPLRFIPGNHDIGESQDAPGEAGLPTLSEATRERYLSHFGLDYWCLEVPGWQILAINDFLLGSDLAAAAAAARFVVETAAAGNGRALALFLHRPLFHRSALEQELGGRFINPRPRAQLLAALAGRPPALIASGHVHQFLSHQCSDSHHVWAPSTGFVIPEPRQPRYGLKQTGYVEHVLEPDGSHVSRLIAVPGLDTLSIADFPQAYAHYAAAAGQGPPPA